MVWPASFSFPLSKDLCRRSGHARPMQATFSVYRHVLSGIRSPFAVPRFFLLLLFLLEDNVTYDHWDNERLFRFSFSSVKSFRHHKQHPTLITSLNDIINLDTNYFHHCPLNDRHFDVLMIDVLMPKVSMYRFRNS